MIDSGVFGSSVELKDRLKTLEEIGPYADHLKGIGLRVVLTQGSWDLLHVNHKRYIAKARSHGDILIVGVDSDEKIRARKGEHRPLIPQEERLEMLAAFRSVDVVVVKELGHPKWALIKAVRPDVLIVSETTRKNKPIPQEELDEIKRYCGEVIVLPAQGEATTTLRIANFTFTVAARIRTALEEAIPRIIGSVTDSLGRKEEG
ncbi:MAG TPA: adenylyltransferase/cytidyltransferase family protein [Candidatus Paceibacterota bacterium]|nr:adenylyltransferase/cytidyltransferase family protein [Candidatus Paceibacterota bacterium]